MTTTLESSPELQAHHGVWPLDEHNQALLRHAHPDDWTNPTPQARYNLVVLGAGTAGLVAAAGDAHVRTGLTPTVKKILSTILAWRR